MNRLLIIVPSRGRPESMRRVDAAWHETGAYSRADLMFAVDGDEFAAYREVQQTLPAASTILVDRGPWRPMVPKLNACAVDALKIGYSAMGFMGDDHLPRTRGWVDEYLAALARVRTGIVYCDDGLQGQRLPTQWAMTSDIVSALGAMVPAGVEHLYCDDVIRDLGKAAGCLVYLEHVLIEHMHYLAGKSEEDAGYRKVNAEEQYRKDHAAYRVWRAVRMDQHAARVRKLREIP